MEHLSLSGGEGGVEAQAIWVEGAGAGQAVQEES